MCVWLQTLEEVLLSATNKRLLPNLSAATDIPVIFALSLMFGCTLRQKWSVLSSSRSHPCQLERDYSLSLDHWHKMKRGFPRTLPAVHVCPINGQGRKMNLHKLNFLCAESVPAGKKKHRSIENELFWEASLLLEEKKKRVFQGRIWNKQFKNQCFH